MKQTATGKGNSFQEALDDAITKALASIKTTDPMISWKLVETAGQHGGIASLQVITVTIEF